jgi:lipopolysaccharide/colanic/teichoic acid biosynthesis glycosyltransferase
VVMPRKLQTAAAYAQNATLLTDLTVIAKTLWLLARR